MWACEFRAAKTPAPPRYGPRMFLQTCSCIRPLSALPGMKTKNENAPESERRGSPPHGDHLGGRATGPPRAVCPVRPQRCSQSRVAHDGSRFTYHSSLLGLPASADSAKVIAMASLIQEVGETFFTLYKGFSVTLRTMFRKTTTESFPDAPPTVQPRYRGIHVLQRDEHGYEKCVGCFLCAAACPANCIYIEAAENTAANRISAGERYAKVYNIDYSRCIFCGYCVEACPTDAITHGHSIELAPYNINALIYRKEQLLEPWPPRAKQP